MDYKITNPGMAAQGTRLNILHCAASLMNRLEGTCIPDQQPGEMLSTAKYNSHDTSTSNVTGTSQEKAHVSRLEKELRHVADATQCNVL